MSDDYELGEIQRLISNLVRVGKITALDEANARVKVSMGGLSSAWLPWGTGRAGTTRKVSMPTVGEQVVVFSPHGDTAQAIVGFSLFQADHPSPSNTKYKETTIYPDGSTVEYNNASNTLTVTIAGSGNVVINCKNATVNADTKVMLTTPLVECSQDLKVDGNLTVTGNTSVTGDTDVQGSTTVKAITSNGHDISSAHKHTGVTSGPALTGPPQ